MIEVSFDPAILDIEAIKAALAEAGYGENLAIAAERGPTTAEDERSRVPRHTAAYAQTGSVISFAQATNPPGSYLWPCPGLGAINAVATMDEGDRHA
jgi:hypothetical protein